LARAQALSDDRRSLYEGTSGLAQQAGLLCEGRFAELDLANLIEEIEAMGRRDKRGDQE
jgi:hypothetical protein